MAVLPNFSWPDSFFSRTYVTASDEFHYTCSWMANQLFHPYCFRLSWSNRMWSAGKVPRALTLTVFSGNRHSHVTSAAICCRVIQTVETTVFLRIDDDQGVQGRSMILHRRSGSQPKDLRDILLAKIRIFITQSSGLWTTVFVSNVDLRFCFM